MLTRWTAHLPEEEKESFKRDIRASRSVLERLKQIIEEDEEALDKSELDQRSYSIPNWSHLQAHRNGNRQVYAVIKKLLDLGV